MGCTSLKCNAGKYNSDGNLTKGCDSNCMPGCLACNSAVACLSCQIGREYSCKPKPEVQEVTVTMLQGNQIQTNKGSFNLTFQGMETEPISVNAAAVEVETALNALSTHDSRLKV